MNEEETQTKDISAPADDLKQTTNDLIKDSLLNAKDESKPWYQRVGYYVGAVVLIVLYYLGDNFGSQIMEKISQLFQ